MVDEMQYSLSVALDGHVSPYPLRVVVILDERHQWRDDERHRRSDFVADVHEEFNLCLVELFRVLVFLHAQPVLVFLPSLPEEVIDERCNDCHIDEVGDG